ncbi:Uncharacterized protein dnm_098040 [Desulfonema magnum]|uniref:Uncharacterized protein n=1 Tax=Desulfonema magnum TaxID=45655 RepID=A0A975BZM5_9BACT|nr:Uncharacterized protein dnm_098040 [Desulfonema magnum]
MGLGRPGMMNATNMPFPRGLARPGIMNAANMPPPRGQYC